MTLSDDDEWFKKAADEIASKGSYTIKPPKYEPPKSASQLFKEVEAVKEAAAAKAMFDAVAVGAAPVLGTAPDTKWPSGSYMPRPSSPRPGSMDVVNVPGHGYVPILEIQRLLDDASSSVNVGSTTPVLSDKEVLKLIAKKIKNSPDPFGEGGKWMLEVGKIVREINADLDQDNEDL